MSLILKIMRELLGELFPFFVILFLIDGITYVNTHHLLLASLFGSRFKLITSGSYFVKLSPVGRLVHSHHLPLYYTSAGVYLLSSRQPYEDLFYQAEDFDFITYDHLNKIEVDGKKVKLNEFVLKTPSPASARPIIKLLQELKDLPPTNRQKTIRDFLTRSTDLQALKACDQAYAQSFFYLKILCSILFINTFAMLPLALYSGWHASINLSFLLLNILLLYLLILGLAYFLHQKIYNTAGRYTLLDLLSAILSPVTAIHMVSHLSKDIYINFDYLAVAAHLLPADIFQYWVRKELYQIGCAKRQAAPGEWVEYWHLREEAILSLLAEANLTLPMIWAAPAKPQEATARYCPLCLADYRAGIQNCRDCGVTLKEFGKF